MKTLEIQAYEILKTRLGEEKATVMIQFIDEKSEEKVERKKNSFLTKDDKVDLLKWMVGFWVAQVAAIGGLYVKMSDLTLKMSDLTLRIADLASAVTP